MLPAQCERHRIGAHIGADVNYRIARMKKFPVAVRSHFKYWRIQVLTDNMIIIINNIIIINTIIINDIIIDNIIFGATTHRIR